MVRGMSPRSRLAATVGILAFAAGLTAVLAMIGPGGRGGDRDDAATAPDVYPTFTADIMATPITVQLPPEHAAEARVVFEVFRDVDRRMSEWKPSSPLSAVNRAAGRAPVAVPDDLRAVLRRGLEINRLTDGAFALTWAALWGLWDFRAEAPTVPDAGQIARRVALVDDTRVLIDDAAGTVLLGEAGMMLGLGGIAKGHALDRAAAALRDRGVERFLLSAGGQITVGGDRDGRPWRVGIRDPRGAIGDYFAFIEVTDASVSTSGDYERFFIQDGIRYHHILDPRTGRPARGLRSATVVSRDATLADALSTAFMILGPDAALALANGMDGVEAVLVDADAAVHVTSGLEDMLRRRHPPAP